MRRILIITACLLLSQTLAAKVEIKGVSKSLQTNILAHLRLDEESCDQTPARVNYRFKGARDRVAQALQPYGYYNANITAELTWPEGGCWTATFTIDPGEPVRYGTVSVLVDGPEASTADFKSLLEKPSMQTGGQLNHNDYDELKGQLLITAREHGYFDAKLTQHRLTIYPEKLLADVALTLDTGERYRFGELHVIGDGLNHDLIHRFARIEPGAPYQQNRIRALQTDLIAGDFFSNVRIRTEQKSDKTVDLYLELVEGRKIRYGIGLGFDTDNGPIIRADLLNRRLNKRGHRLALDTFFSAARQNATLDYRIPGPRPERDWYSIYSGLTRKDTDSLDTISWTSGVRMNRFHSLRWNSTPFLEYTLEQFTQDGESEVEQVLVPGYSITYLDTNATDRPTRGIRLSGEIAGASRWVVSDVSFARFRFNAKTILPITRRGRLLVRGEVGAMATSNFDQVPPSWRFHAGGDRSVRGYDYESLGPQDDEGKSLGGERLFTSSVEGDWRVFNAWSLAVFADAGNVGKDELFKNLPWSVGAGIRWYSPVGPIRLDLAFPQTGDNNFRVHISMGPDL